MPSCLSIYNRPRIVPGGCPRTKSLGRGVAPHRGTPVVACRKGRKGKAGQGRAGINLSYPVYTCRQLKVSQGVLVSSLFRVKILGVFHWNPIRIIFFSLHRDSLKAVDECEQPEKPMGSLKDSNLGFLRLV